MNQFKLLLADISSMTEVSFDEESICHKIKFTDNHTMICSFKSIDEDEIIVTQTEEQLIYENILLNRAKEQQTY